MTDAELAVEAAKHNWQARTTARAAGLQCTGWFRERMKRLRKEAASSPAPAAAPVVFQVQGNEQNSAGDEEPGAVIPPPPPPVIPIGRELTVALAGDVHAPDIDKPAWSAFLRWTRDVQPDVIVLNEMVEWLSMSRHGGNWGAMFDQDVAAGRRIFAQVRSLNPDARIVCLETNHDTRIARTVQDVLPSLAGRLAVPQELRLADMGIEWIPQKLSFRIGRLKVIHGHQLGSGPKQMLPENACKRAIQRYGEPGWTLVFFHTHRKGYWAERHDSGLYEAVNLPCLRTLAPDWLDARPAGWSHGFGVAHIGPAGQTNLYPVDIENGSFVYGGQRYSEARAA
jgi:hypothetical protein